MTRELQVWADSLTRGLKPRVIVASMLPGLGAFRDWLSPEDAVYDEWQAVKAWESDTPERQRRNFP
jgi:hypothetical protein